MRTKNRRTRIIFPVFNGYVVHIILSQDVRRTARRLRCDDGPAVAFFLPGNKRGWLVLPLDADAGTIAHEASHAVQALFQWTGVRRDEETFAYHLDFIVGRVDRFKNKGRK